MKTAAYIPLHRAVPLFLCPRWLLLRRIRPLFYINGPDVLPQPLSREEEANALRALESGGQAREAARALLIERNLRLVAFLARRFENTGVGIEDLISIGTLGLIKAVETFRSDKNIKLATYASRCIENEILMYLRKISGRSRSTQTGTAASFYSRIFSAVMNRRSWRSWSGTRNARLSGVPWTGWNPGSGSSSVCVSAWTAIRK